MVDLTNVVKTMPSAQCPSHYFYRWYKLTIPRKIGGKYDIVVATLTQNCRRYTALDLLGIIIIIIQFHWEIRLTIISRCRCRNIYFVLTSIKNHGGLCSL